MDFPNLRSFGWTHGKFLKTIFEDGKNGMVEILSKRTVRTYFTFGSNFISSLTKSSKEVRKRGVYIASKVINSLITSVPENKDLPGISFPDYHGQPKVSCTGLMAFAFFVSKYTPSFMKVYDAALKELNSDPVFSAFSTEDREKIVRETKKFVCTPPLPLSMD